MVAKADLATEFALRQFRVDWERLPVLFPEPMLALGQVSIDDVYKAREFVRSVGSVEEAMAALVALKQFGGEGAGAAEQISDCRWPDRQAASKRLDEST